MNALVNLFLRLMLLDVTWFFDLLFAKSSFFFVFLNIQWTQNDITKVWENDIFNNVLFKGRVVLQSVFYSKKYEKKRITSEHRLNCECNANGPLFFRCIYMLACFEGVTNMSVDYTFFQKDIWGWFIVTQNTSILLF